MDGRSLLPSFLDADAPEHRRTQYFEVHGHRALYHDGWMASAYHGRVPWSLGLPEEPRPMEEDRWELYHLDEVFSHARDIAAQAPALLHALTNCYASEAHSSDCL